MNNIKQQLLTRNQFIMLLANTPEEYIYDNKTGEGKAWFYSNKFVEPLQMRQDDGKIREFKLSEIPLRATYWVVQHENN